MERYEDLEFFDIGRRCAACGSDKASSNFDRREEVRQHDPHPLGVVRIDYSIIVRTCGVCGYSWEEKPLYMEREEEEKG